MVGIWNFSSILILLFFFGNHMSMSGAMWCYITMYRFDSHCTLVILFVFFLHDCRLTSLKYLLLRIWGTLTASWNIVGIEALMMSIRRKRKSQNTNRKEHLLMPSSRNHMVEQCRCVKINYKNEAVKTSATPTKCAVYLYATTLTSGAAPSYSGSPNDWNWTQAMTVVPELHIQRRHLSAAAVTVVPEHKQFCDEAIS